MTRIGNGENTTRLGEICDGYWKDMDVDMDMSGGTFISSSLMQREQERSAICL